MSQTTTIQDDTGQSVFLERIVKAERWRYTWLAAVMLTLAMSATTVSVYSLASRRQEGEAQSRLTKIVIENAALANQERRLRADFVDLERQVEHQEAEIAALQASVNAQGAVVQEIAQRFGIQPHPDKSDQ